MSLRASRPRLRGSEQAGQRTELSPPSNRREEEPATACFTSYYVDRDHEVFIRPSMWLCLRLLRLLSLVGALLSPACLAGVPIAEEDGGGQSAIMPFEIGDTAMVVQGTSFASSVASNHVRVPTPEGATEGSLFIMVSSTNTRNVELCMSLCMYDCQDLLCLTLSFTSLCFRAAHWR